MQKHANIVPQLLAAHGLSGCDTVAQLYGIEKGTVVKKLKAGHGLSHLGNIDASIDDVLAEATAFISACYVSKTKGDLSEVRVEVWSKKMGRKKITSAPELKSIPPTKEAFRENVLRAHIQVAIWKSTLESAPPSLDATKYGWTRDEANKTLTPTTLPSDVPLAPPAVLQLISRGCSTDQPCQNGRCGCESAHLPCTFFCACGGGSKCQNIYNKRTDTDQEDDANADSLEI